MSASGKVILTPSVKASSSASYACVSFNLSISSHLLLFIIFISNILLYFCSRTFFIVFVLFVKISSAAPSSQTIVILPSSSYTAEDVSSRFFMAGSSKDLVVLFHSPITCFIFSGTAFGSAFFAVFFFSPSASF